MDNMVMGGGGLAGIMAMAPAPNVEDTVVMERDSMQLSPEQLAAILGRNQNF